jgi:hypothetical protein
MRMLVSAAIVIAVTAAPALAQTPASPQQELSALLRQDATLREQIGRIQLDALISRVDQTIGHRSRPVSQPGKGGALQHDLDLYTF